MKRWSAARRKPPLRQMGVDEIYLGTKQKFVTVVCNLETAEPLWLGRERKQETLDGFFTTELNARQRRESKLPAWTYGDRSGRVSNSGLPCVRSSIDRFHIRQHSNATVDEVRRAEFFRKGGLMLFALNRLVRRLTWPAIRSEAIPALCHKQEDK